MDRHRHRGTVQGHLRRRSKHTHRQRRPMGIPTHLGIRLTSILHLHRHRHTTTATKLMTPAVAPFYGAVWQLFAAAVCWRSAAAAASSHHFDFCVMLILSRSKFEYSPKVPCCLDIFIKCACFLCC